MRSAVRSTVVVLALLGAVSFVGCKKGSEKKGPRQASILNKAPFLALVPDDAVLVVAVDGVERLATSLGYSQIVAKYKAQYDQAAAEVKKAAGHDLLDPAQWAAAGLDAKKPGGLAVFSLRNESGAVYVPVTDAKLAEETLRAMARADGEELESRQAGKATILEAKGDDDVVIVIRDGYLIAIFADDEGADARQLAAEVAGLEPADSLEKQKRFKSTIGLLDGGRDAALYVDLDALFTAVADGDEREIIRKIMGDGALAVGAQIEKRSIGFTAAIGAPAESYLRKLYKNGKGEPRVLRALDREPLILAHLALDMDGVKKLIEDLVRMEGGGEALADAKREMKGVIGIGYDELFKLFTGEIGFVMTGDLEAALRSGDDEDVNVGGGLVIGITDQEQVQSLWKKLRRLGVIPGAEDDGFELPGLGRVTIEFGKGAVALSTDAEFAKRAVGGGSSAVAKAFTNEELVKLLKVKDVAGLVTENIGAMAFFFVAKRSERASARVVNALPPDASDALKQKQAELEKLEQEIEALEKKIDRDEQEHLLGLFKLIGTFGFVLTETNDGLVMTGGQYLSSTVPEAVLSAIDHAIALDGISRQQNELWAKRDKAYQLQAEIERLRYAPPDPAPAPPPPIPFPPNGP